MKLTKKVQYGLLLTTYLTRTGFSNLKDAASNLGLSVTFLEQVARQLRLSGIISVKRGPGGGYELNRDLDVTVGDVVRALGSTAFLSQHDVIFNTATKEGHSLNFVDTMFKAAIAKVLETKIKFLTAPYKEFAQSVTAQS